MRCLEQLAVSSLSILLLLFFFSEASKASTVIYLKEYVFLEKEKILLKDISTVKSDNKSLERFLKNLKIGTLNSSEKRINLSQIKYILKKNFIDTSHIVFLGKSVLVRRVIKSIDRDSILKDVKEYLKKHYKSVEIERISVPRIRKIKGSSLHIKIKESSKTSSFIYLSYEIFKNGELIRKVTVPVKYRKISYVVFARSDIHKGDLFSRNNITLKKYRGNTRHLFGSIEELIGSKARINIKKGSVIKDYMVEPDYKVLRGSSVKIIYNKGWIHIELLGRALENGQLNQIIRVKNISTGKVIPCKVIGENQVLFIGGSL